MQIKLDMFFHIQATSGSCDNMSAADMKTARQYAYRAAHKLYGYAILKYLLLYPFYFSTAVFLAVTATHAARAATATKIITVSPSGLSPFPGFWAVALSDALLST